uniref:Unique cartilage matrix-associated protein n=1 Tax=Poecilia reticulata TaxID=8081 RepID=A0A3P9NP84_POERE
MSWTVLCLIVIIKTIIIINIPGSQRLSSPQQPHLMTICFTEITLLNLKSGSLPTYLISSVFAAEQRQVLAADERKREFHEEKRNEFESYAEEDNDGLFVAMCKTFTGCKYFWKILYVSYQQRCKKASFLFF